MNPKTLVKLSNIIGLISIILLILWIFVFTSIEVFGLKIFRRHMTETFYMSIFAILALMFGALMINIMFNLSRIAEKLNNDISYKSRKPKKLIAIFCLSFPLIFGLLFLGDYRTSKKKESILNKTAESILIENKQIIDSLVNYSYTKHWLINANDMIDFLSEKDKDFPNIEVLVKDTVKGSNVYLGFNGYKSIYVSNKDTTLASKNRFIRKTSQSERDYLQSVFNGETKNSRFTAHDGNYELFFPYEKNGRIIVFYFSDYQRYGKSGS